jgi:transposase
LDDAYLESLEEDALRALSGKLLADLKEARERLNQNSRNSSRPPSREAPWEKPKAGDDAPPAEGGGKGFGPGPGPEPAEAAEASGAGRAGKPTPKRAGKRKGAPGHGREAPEQVDRVEYHPAARCAGCGAALPPDCQGAYTGYYEVDWVREGAGWFLLCTKHLWQEGTCRCGHVTRAEPFRHGEGLVDLGGFRLVGPGLASLIVALALRYRLSRGRIREFPGDWLGVWLGTGTIHAAIDEAGVVVSPAEAELVEAIQGSGLLHADETPWPEQWAPPGTSLWLWVFVSAQAVLHYVSHRGRELVGNLLQGFTGVLMSDGWQAYRLVRQRLRCWAHLKRKAVGLAEGFNPEARAFGQEVLGLWKDLQAAVHKAREGPPGSIRADWETRLQAFRQRCEAARTCAHGKTHELAGEFLNDWDAIFHVLDDPRWPLTNNEAERALRHWVILRQLTHGTRTDHGSRRLALLASVIDTCRQRKHSPWDYLRTAITRRRQGLALQPLPV